MSKRFLFALFALSAPMILSGCEASNSAAPSPTQIPGDCDQFLVTVKDPIDGAAEADNALAILAEYRAKLGIANKRITKGRECNVEVRGRFAGGSNAAAKR